MKEKPTLLEGQSVVDEWEDTIGNRDVLFAIIQQDDQYIGSWHEYGMKYPHLYPFQEERPTREEVVDTFLRCRLNK